MSAYAGKLGGANGRIFVMRLAFPIPVLLLFAASASAPAPTDPLATKIKTFAIKS